MSIFTDDTVKYLRFYNGAVEITEKVISGSFKCENYLVTEQMNFGECNSARIQFQTSENLNLTGEKITIRYGAGDEYSIVGTYKVTYSSTKVNSTVTQLTAYDCSKEFDVDMSEWHKSLSWPMKIKSLRNSLCSYLGIQQNDATLINDEVYILDAIEAETLNGRDMLAWIGQVNACFAHDMGDYKISWVSLGSTDNIVDSSLLIGANSFEAKNYETAPISGVTILSEDGDVGISVGSGANKYLIQANPLMYGLSNEVLTNVAQNVYDSVSSVAYTPCSVTMKYIPEYSLGTKLLYEGKVFYVMGMKLSGMLDVEISADGNQYLDNETSVATQITQLRGRSNVLKRDLDSTNLKIDNLDEGLSSEIEQLANSVSIEINNLQGQIDGSIGLYYVDEEPTLLNYPAWDFTYNIPCDNTVQTTEDLRFEYNDTFYRKNIRALAFNEDTGITYRFSIKDGAWFWDVVENTETALILSKISKLEISDEQIQATVEQQSIDIDDLSGEITTAKSQITQNANSITSEVSRAKGIENSLSSKITQTASDISAEVSRATKQEGNLSTRITANANGLTTKVSKDSIISEINQSAEAVTIKANKVNLSGYVTATSLMESGKTVINGGNITTGSISCDRLNGGTIRGQKFSGGEIEIGITQINNLGTIETSQFGKNNLNGPGQTFSYGGWDWKVYDEAYNTTEITAGIVMTYDGPHKSYMLPQYMMSNYFCETNGGSAMMGWDMSHTYHCHWTGSVLQFEVDTTWVWSSSDKRLKKNIQRIQDDYIEAIGAVDMVQYNLNRANYSDKELYFGAIAQDIAEQLDVRGLPDDDLKLLSKQKISDDDDTLYYGMDYEQFLLLRLAYDEKRIAKLEEQIDILMKERNK